MTFKPADPVTAGTRPVAIAGPRRPPGERIKAAPGATPSGVTVILCADRAENVRGSMLP